ncbi:MAG: MarR family transcriptional regulator [Anaerolineae bacterium]|nr:MarR family transcriptional regulator [Anaerolineae bacterium]
MTDLSSPLLQRTELIKALYQAGRELSTTAVLFHSVVAEQVGLNVTEWKCLDILELRGPLMAGELAELTGLTTGAITGVIDRLEQGGFVRRERDPHDRRKVIVQPTGEHKQGTIQVFETLMQRYAELFEAYNEQELAFILDYLTRSTAVMAAETARLRQEAKLAERSKLG